MRLYWRQTRRGQRLVIGDEDQDSEQEIGGVRETKSGFDAFAKTFGYEPGRAEKGMPTMDKAKASSSPSGPGSYMRAQRV